MTALLTPAHVPAELVRDLDVTADADVLADPWAALDRLRGDGPVLWSPRLGGYWVVLGSDEVREAYQRADVFSSYPTGLPSMEGFWPRRLSPQELDGPAHTRVRRLLAPFFNPGAIRPLADAVRERCARLLDGIDPDAGCDFVRDIGRPLPQAVFSELFGLPLEQADVFTTWTKDILHSDDPQLSAHTGGLLVTFLIELIAQRRADPKADMISRLVATTVDGEPLSDEECLDIAFLLFIAGGDTVTSQLGTFFHHLATHPEDQARARESAESRAKALDELLRLYNIVPPVRNAVTDHVLGGVTIKAGDRLLLCSSTASRDAGTFPDATEFRLDRTVSWTAAFGLGPHRCLGMHLARQELTIVLEQFLTVLPPFRLAPDAEPHWHTSGNVWGVDTLPLVFDR
ncbi:cytochrome P450 [Jatrophihabitans fulvus]